MPERRPRRPRVLSLAALALVAAGMLSRLSAGTDATGPLAGYNLIVINIDTLRADHLGCYGYTRDTSPFIDSLARQGVLLEEARSNSSYTRESVAVLLSGSLPSRSGSVGWTATPSATRATLAVLLARAGYRTGFFSATTVLTDPLFTRGFQTVEHLTDRWGVSGLGPKLSAEALAFAKRGGDGPFLMYLHYLDPHGPYDPPPDLYRRFAPAPFASPVNLYSDVRPHLEELVAQGFGPGEPRFEDMVLRYDAEIAGTDRAIAELFAGLGSVGLLDRTLVVLTADHGEEFLDHGFVEHAWTLYDEVLRVPLIFWAPRALPAARVARRAATVDVLPTLLRLMVIPHDRGDLDGEPLFDVTGGRIRALPVGRPFVGELLIPERNVVRTSIAANWKYLAAWKWLPPSARPSAARVEDEVRRVGGDKTVDVFRGPIVHEELYDLARDPHEAHDTLAAAPDVRRALRARLEAYVVGSGAGGSRAPELSPEDRARLRALGYVE